MALDLPVTSAAAVPFWLAIVLRRMLRLVVLVCAVAAVAFALAKVSPIDPVDAYLGPAITRAGPEQRALIAARWGFDQPFGVQFAAWAKNLLSGDLGESVVYGQPVATVIAERARASFVLMASAWILSGFLGFLLGLLAGAFEGSAGDRIIRAYAYVLASTPAFWCAIILLLVFSVALGWMPVCCAAPPGMLDRDVTILQRLHHLVLPILTLSVLGVAQITLHTRAKMVEIMRSDMALYARAQGAGRLDVLLRHGARNAALPALTIQFASLGELFGGSILAEQVFSYPGLGRATIEAGLRGDVPLLLAITLLTTICVSLGNSLSDLLAHLVDPRLRRAGAGR